MINKLKRYWLECALGTALIVTIIATYTVVVSV